MGLEGPLYLQSPDILKDVKVRVTNRILETQVKPITEGITYWESILDSSANKLLYCLQIAPFYPFLKQNNEVSSTGFSSCGPMVNSVGLNHSALIPRFSVFRTVKQQVQQKIELLRIQKGNKLSHIGSILTAKQDLELIGCIQAALDIDPIISPTKIDEDILDYSLNQLKLEYSLIPPIHVRWWLFALFGTLSTFVVRTYSNQAFQWFKNTVVQTGQSFFKNWVVDPLYKVFLTIKHDGSDQIALIARDSLTSDIDSLQRMVISFIQDTNPQITIKDLENIKYAAKNGDVTPVMTAYESQISNPVVNIVTGKLVRTLLIQVQKAKVDLEVALSGIDRLLQSQQLVFGLVAAIPAIFVVFQSYLAIKRYFRLNSIAKTKELAYIVRQHLFSMDHILLKSEGSQLSLAELGGLFAEVHSTSQLTIQQQKTGLESTQDLLNKMVEVGVDTLNRDEVWTLLDRVFTRLPHGNF